MSADAIACLRAGLLFCSPGWRSNIEARIAALEEPPQTSEPTVAQALRGPGVATGGSRPTPSEPNVNAAAGVTSPGEQRAPHWRAARKALRQAGHDVQQVEGVVYVDGRYSNDPALYPDDGDQDTRL